MGEGLSIEVVIADLLVATTETVVGASEADPETALLVAETVTEEIVAIAEEEGEEGDLGPVPMEEEALLEEEAVADTDLLIAETTMEGREVGTAEETRLLPEGVIETEDATGTVDETAAEMVAGTVGAVVIEMHPEGGRD
jgi:hypothetical protein